MVSCFGPLFRGVSLLGFRLALVAFLFAGLVGVGVLRLPVYWLWLLFGLALRSLCRILSSLRVLSILVVLLCLLEGIVVRLSVCSYVLGVSAIMLPQIKVLLRLDGGGRAVLVLSACEFSVVLG